MVIVITFVIRLNTLQVKKVVFQIALIIILQESELIHVIIYLLKKILAFHNAIILIMSVLNKNKNEYSYNIFLEKDS